MSNLEDTKAQIPSVFWTIANGVFLASGIALIVMRNDYLWGVICTPFSGHISLLLNHAICVDASLYLAGGIHAVFFWILSLL